MGVFFGGCRGMALYRTQAMQVLTQAFIREVDELTRTNTVMSEDEVRLVVDYTQGLLETIEFLADQPEDYIFEDRCFFYLTPGQEAILLWNELYPSAQ